MNLRKNKLLINYMIKKIKKRIVRINKRIVILLNNIKLLKMTLEFK